MALDTLKPSLLLCDSSCPYMIPSPAHKPQDNIEPTNSLISKTSKYINLYKLLAKAS